ncbi:MAG: ribonuclease III [Clostridia bacterium]|nr:ribonuclease III [Clostridia bacterium]
MFDLNAIEKAIGYTFKDEALIRRAVTHSSFSNECRDGSGDCNEKLEFLGDSLLSAIVSEYLYKSYPDLNESGLSNLRRELVDGEALAAFADSIGIGDFLILGKGEEQNGGRTRSTNLEDAFEAIVAALYLDGGRRAAEDFIMRFAKKKATEVLNRHSLTDPKTKLQEIVQRDGTQAPKYVITGESGPDHSKFFECDVLVDGNVMGHGSGRSKKDAEKAAARRALEYFIPHTENEESY